ncbi:MAG: DUF2007 domain-containing protein [bacterium]|nr:DUF2007 domain-containing protein [bacterium]
MICPECKSEYNPGITVCADCGIPLVTGLPETSLPEAKPPVANKYIDNPPAGSDYEELVTVLQTGDQGLLLLAKSLLEEAGIRYFIPGEITQHLLGYGCVGIGYNPLIGRPCLKVRKSDAGKAEELLTDFLQAMRVGESGHLSPEAERLCCSDDDLE